jgi:hypothetical protein
MGPRTSQRNIEMIAIGFCLKSAGAICGNLITECCRRANKLTFVVFLFSL